MQTPNDVKISEELRKMEYEPLQPIENKLIVWSLVLGVSLLFILYWISAVFFPAAHGG